MHKAIQIRKHFKLLDLTLLPCAIRKEKYKSTS